MPRETQHIAKIEARRAASESIETVHISQRLGASDNSGAMFGARVGPAKFYTAFREKRSRHDADCSTLVTFLFASLLGKSC